MKNKITASILAAMFLVGATAAYAQPQPKAPQGGRERPAMERDHKGPRPQMTEAQKADREQMRKLRDELIEELRKENVDKAKATKLFDQIADLREKQETERFEHRLNNPRGPREQGRRGPQMSEQERARAEKLREANKALREELRKENPDKAKARKLYGEVSKLKKEVAKSRFEKMLDNPRRKEVGKRPELPAQTKAKFDQLKAVDEKFRAEAEKESPNKDTLRSLHKEKQKIKNELDDERFENMLNNPEGLKGSKGSKGPKDPDGGRPGEKGGRGHDGGRRGEPRHDNGRGAMHGPDGAPGRGDMIDDFFEIREPKEEL